MAGMMSGRFQLTAPVSEMKLANRELGTVERIAEGRISVKMDGGRDLPDRLRVRIHSAPR